MLSSVSRHRFTIVIDHFLWERLAAAIRQRKNFAVAEVASANRAHTMAPN
jgi:hypothetical protein